MFSVQEFGLNEFICFCPKDAAEDDWKDDDLKREEGFAELAKAGTYGSGQSLSSLDARF